MAVLDVITYEGGNDVLVYRHPRTEFNTMSQLVVHESQKAILFRDGKMLDTFGPGRHTLHTGNIPLLSKLINLPFGGESPFRCEVYFVNEALALNYKWGTFAPARVMDPQFQLLLDIGASGTIGLRVLNPRMLISKVVGTEPELTAEACLNFFREQISTQAKVYLARVMRNPQMSFILLETYLLDFSTAVKAKLSEDFQDVGVEIYSFVIGTIHIPDEQYSVIRESREEIQRAGTRITIKKMEAQGDADAEIIRAKGTAESRRIQGYNWADEQVAEILKVYAGSGTPQSNPANMLAQAPMAFAFGEMLKDSVGGFTNKPQNFRFGNNSGSSPDPMSSFDPFGPNVDLVPDPTDAFPPNPVTPDPQNPEQPHFAASVSQAPMQVPSDEDRRARLRELKGFLDDGLISQAEYDDVKNDILNQLRGR